MWDKNALVGLDLETTSVEPESARIVGACVVTVNGSRSWLVNPGVPIEAGATAVHGMTDEHVSVHGADPAEAVPAIVARVRSAWEQGRIVVVFNAPFDLTVLDRESRRVSGTGLGRIGPVIDSMVLDKLLDPFRRGSRRLADVAAHYLGTELAPDRVHDAAQDATLALRVAWRIGRRNPAIGFMELDKLQRVQTEAKARQARSLDDYFRRTGHPEAGKVDGSWPIRPLPADCALTVPDWG